MFKIYKEKKIANKVANKLYKKGFKVKMKISKNSKSIYLEIDNGACSTVRISDHKNYRTRSKYNVIKNYQGKSYEYNNNIFKKFYNFNMLNSLIVDIETERSNKILKDGYAKYKAIRDKKDLENYYIYNKKVA